MAPPVGRARLTARPCASRLMQTSAVSWSSTARTANQAESGFATSDAAKPGAASSARTAPAERQAEHEPGREARLRGRRAGVALRAVGRLAGRGELAQQRGEVAAGVALQQHRGGQRVPRVRARALAQAHEHGSVGSPSASARAAVPSSCAAAPSAAAAASAIAVRIERPAPSASAIVRAHAGAARRSSSRQRRRRARVTATTAAGPASAASSPSAGPPTSQPAASSAAAATAHSRRRSGAVGARPSRPARASGSSTRADRGGDPGALDGGERLPRPGDPGARRAGRQPRPPSAHRGALGGRKLVGPPADGGGVGVGGEAARPTRRPAARRPRTAGDCAAAGVNGVALAAASRPASVSPSGARQDGRPARTVNSSRTAGPPATRTTSRDLDDPAHAVRAALLPHDEVDRVGDLVADRRERQPDVRHQRERLEPAQRLGRAAGVDRAERAGVARAQRDQQVERLRTAHLADDQPVGPHPQRVAHEPADRHLAAALEVRRSRLEPHHVRQREPQLGGVLDRHDALARVDERRQRAERRRLARPGAAADQQRAARRDGAAEEVEQRRRQRPVRDQVGRREPARPEAADRQQRAVERERRQHHVHARAVGQPRVAQRLGLVGAPPERREDPLDHVAQLGLAAEAHVGLRQPAAALDPDRRRPADEQLVDRRIAQQRLERPEPDRPLGHPRGERRARRGVEHAGLALDERADPRGRIVAAGGVARAVDEPVAQRAGERCRSRRPEGPWQR